jgi:hypothetical protein
MADEPVTEQEPVEDTAPVEPEVETPEAPEVRYMTPEEVAEAVSRGTNDLKTWIGRRDKDLFGQLGTLIDQKIPKVQQDPTELSDALLQDPVSTIRKIVSESQSEESQKAQSHHSQTFEYLGSMMDSDPLYQDKDLGTDLIEEVKKQFQGGKIDRSLSPKSAASVLHAEALANVLRARQGKSALSKNKPASGIGSLAPGVPGGAPKIKAPKLSPDVQKLADKWGYKPEDLARVYGTDNTK